MGDHLFGREYPVVGIAHAQNMTWYDLDTTPPHWWRKKKTTPFQAHEVTIVRGGS
jgi:hypothetical protein